MVDVGFIGLGKLGLPIALAIESKGHQVVATDPADGPQRILRSRKLEHREAGASALLEQSRLELVPLQETVRRSQLLFVTIETPHAPEFEGVTRLPAQTRGFDTSRLCAGMADLSRAIEQNGEERIVVVVSTVLPGTIRRELKPLMGPRARLCYNPFFIAMGTAIADFLAPEFVLFGVDDDRAASAAEAFYRTIHDAPFRRTTLEEAELIKVLYNTFISTKIAFANTAMELAHHVPGANVDVVLDVLAGANQRIISGKYLSAGMGDGGGCHPRDNIALSHFAKEVGLSFDWFRAVMQQRERQTEWLCELIEQHRGGRKVVILGRSFKPESNILTGSAAVLLTSLLEERGTVTSAWDPHVDRGVAPPTDGPFCYFIGTRHPEFRKFPFAPGSVVLDPWRFVEPAANVEYVPIGKGPSAPAGET